MIFSCCRSIFLESFCRIWYITGIRKATAHNERATRSSFQSNGSLPVNLKFHPDYLLSRLFPDTARLFWSTVLFSSLIMSGKGSAILLFLRLLFSRSCHLTADIQIVPNHDQNFIFPLDLSSISRDFYVSLSFWCFYITISFPVCQLFSENLFIFF